MSEFAVTSEAFTHRGEIPRRHTCEGDDVSPTLSWSDPPPGTRTLALIVDELGKMELTSQAFRAAVAALFDRRASVVATVQTASHPFTDAIKRRRDVEVLHVTTANRDELPGQLAERLREP